MRRGLSAMLSLLLCLVIALPSLAQISPAPQGHILQDEGTTLPQQPYLSFVGPGIACTNDAANRKTTCTIAGAALPSSYAVGDLLYADTTTTLAKLADVATGRVLVSGGVSTAPAWSPSPTLATSLTTPITYGGTAAGSTLSLRGTSNGTPSSAYVLLNPSAEGFVGVNGVSTPLAALHVADTATGTVRGMLLGQHTTDTTGAQYLFRKSRGTLASPTSVAISDALGQIVFEGYDGSNYLQMGSITVDANGSTIAATHVPTRMFFKTGSNATPSVLSTALILSNAQGAQFFGPVSGITTLSMSGALSGLTTIAASSTINATSGYQVNSIPLYQGCSLVVGTENGSALADADIGPQGQQCKVRNAGTLVEIGANSDAGTPSVIVRKKHCATSSGGVCTSWTSTDVLSSALAAAASNFDACSKTGATTSLDGVTTCSATLQNTALAAGDWLELKSGTAGGTAKRLSVSITYSIP